MPRKTPPVWKDDSKPAAYPPLRKDIAADVAIIGGGLAGVSLAYLLAGEGRRVVLLEKSRIGGGATEYTTAFLTQEIDTDPSDLIEMFGADKTKLIWESHGTAIEEIRRIAKAEKLDCELVRCPAIIYAHEEKVSEAVRAEHKALKRLGVPAGFSQDARLGFRHYGAISIPDQGKFHPLKFLYALAAKASAKGVQIFERTEAKKITGRNVFKVSTPRGTVTAPRVVVASYEPSPINPAKTWFKKGMYVSYVCEAHIRSGLIPEGIYWDLANPYNYFRVDPRAGFDRLILGGQDHRAEIKMSPERNFRALEDYLDGILGGEAYSLARRWTGPILEPSDGLALIGEWKPGRYVATGFSGNGMTYSLISAMLIRDLVLGRRNPWAELYDPARIPSLGQLARKGRDYAGEFLGGAVRNTVKYRR